MMSVQDRKDMELWDTTVKKEGQHYSLPLPLKEKEPFLQNNRLKAEKRLASLSRKFARQLDLHEKYKEGISSLLCRGHAIEVSQEQIFNRDKTWYLI